MLVEVPAIPVGVKIELEKAVASLELLLLAAREGKHFICLNGATFRDLRGRLELKPSVEDELSHHAALFSERAALQRELSVFARVCWEGHSRLLAVEQREIAIDYRFFADSQRVQPPVLLGENDVDAELFLELARKSVPYQVRLRTQGGGGDTTSERFSRIVSNEEGFVVSVVDSDRRYPDAPLGATARALRRVLDEESYPYSRGLILPWRELENMLPYEVWLEVGLSVDPRLWSGCDDAQRFRKFGELKDGIKGWCLNEGLRADHESLRVFWTRSRDSLGWRVPALCRDCSCTKRSECTEMVSSGVGGGALGLATEAVRKGPRQTIRGWLDRVPELDILVGEVAAWGCAPRKAHT